MTRWLRPIALLAALGLAAWQVKLLLAALAGASGGPNVDTAPVRRGPFVVGITREGTLESAIIAQIRAPRSGSTLAFVVDDGSRVEEGQVIARVDVSEYQFQVDRQRLDYQNRLAQVEQERRNREREWESSAMEVDKTLRSLEVLLRSQFVETGQAQAQLGYDEWNLNWAMGDYDKHERLAEAGIVPRADVEQAERIVRREEFALQRSERRLDYLDSEHSSRQAQMDAELHRARFESQVAERRIGEAVDSARTRAQMARDRLAEMERELASGELRAPQAGVVVLGTTWDPATGRRALREGDRVWWGSKIADLTDLSELEVALQVEETSAGRLRLGQEALIKVVGIADREFRGEISRISAIARRVQPWDDPHAPMDQRVFDVSVKVLDPDLTLLRPGMKARVQFVFARLDDVLSIPLAAVFERPEGPIVYVAGPGGFRPRPVETGERSDEAVVILAGLEPNERVALADPTRLEHH